MRNHHFSNISLSTFMCVGGVAGGAALTNKLGGSDAALSFVKFGTCMMLALLTIQVIFAIKSQSRALYLIVFNIAFASGIVCFLLCLILPIFWIPTIDASIKIFLSIISVGLWSINVLKGVKIFDLKWASAGQELLARFYRRKEGEIDWDGLSGALRMSVSVYLPGVSQKLNSVLSFLIAVSMLAGLALRNVFPIYSVFSWGIPIIIVISIFAQMMGFGVAQFLKIGALEREQGVFIRPK